MQLEVCYDDAFMHYGMDWKMTLFQNWGYLVILPRILVDTGGKKTFSKQWKTLIINQKCSLFFKKNIIIKLLLPMLKDDYSVLVTALKSLLFVVKM